MSDDNADRPKSPTDAKTIIGAGTGGSGAHNRPLAPHEYSMHRPNGRFEQPTRNEGSGLLRPNAAAGTTPGAAGTGVEGGSGLLRPNDRTIAESSRAKRPSQITGAPGVASKHEATTILPGGA